MKTLNEITEDGMTPEREYSNLRHFFAAAALQGILAKGDLGNSNIICKECYRLADEMIEASKK